MMNEVMCMGFVAINDEHEALRQKYEAAVAEVEFQYNEFIQELEAWKARNADDFEAFRKYCDMSFEAAKRKNNITFKLWSRYCEADFDLYLTDDERDWFNRCEIHEVICA